MKIWEVVNCFGESRIVFAGTREQALQKVGGSWYAYEIVIH